METQILMLVVVCGFFSVSEAIKCYECLRHEVGSLAEGEGADKCETIKDDTKQVDNCNACVRESHTIGYEYLKRYCWKEAADQCKTGKLDLNINRDGKDESKKVDRKCCTEDLCNNEAWDADSASGLQLAGSLLAAIFVAVYVNLH